MEISRGFWLGTYEVTQGQWEAVMGEYALSLVGIMYGRMLVVIRRVYISWHAVQEFIE